MLDDGEKRVERSRRRERRGAQLDLRYRRNDNLELGLTGGYQHPKADLSSGSDISAGL